MPYEIEFSQAMPFTQHLANAILNGKLIAGSHGVIDWLRLLETRQLNGLIQLLEDVVNGAASPSQDLLELVIHLFFLETKQQALNLDDMADALAPLLMVCQIELYVREGYLEIFGRWRLSDFEDTDHYARLTPAGYEVAQAPGAPIFMHYLLGKANNANGN